MFRLLSNNRGESIVTLMISAVILLAVAMMAAPTILNSLRQQQNSVGAPNLCRSVAHNIINQIRADGVQSHFYSTRVDSRGTFLNDASWQAGDVYNPQGVTNELIVNPALQGQRWPANRVVDFALGSPPFRSDSPLLIRSSVNGLLALYNTSTEVCDPGLPITDSNEVSNLYPGPSLGGYNVSANLILRPYDWSTRAILPCNRPLHIRPYGTHEPPMAQQLGIADFSRYQADRGLEVEVQVITSPIDLDPNNPTQRETMCVVKEKFEFDRITNEPKAPVVTANGGRFTFQNVMTAGTHMVCRSTHYFMVDFLGRATGSATDTGNRTDWLPCDRLRACDQDGTTSIDATTSTITKNFALPANCVVTVEAKTFDAIGNVSDTQPASSFGGDSRVPASFDETSDSTVNGYEVGGVQFSTAAAAAKASALSGLPVQTIAEVPVGMDAVMNSVYGNVQSAGTNYSNAASANASAQSSLATAQNAANNATSATSNASSARSSATEARSAADAAAASAASARSAADAAQAAADAVAAEAGALGSAIGDPAVAEAQAAADAAEAEAKAAEEAARLAAEAAKAAEEAAKDKEDSESASAT